MLKAILIDDEESNLSSLSEKLTKHCPQIVIVAKCENAQDGITAIESLLPDVVFLDIEMPIMNGFLLLRQLTYKNFGLIFVTAYDHYAIKAIRCSALDYLVKPVEVTDLKNAVLKAETNRASKHSQSQIELLLEQLNKQHPRRLSVPTTDGLQFISVEDVVYLEANDNYTNIYLLTRQKMLVSRTLKSFEEMLPTDTFLRIHHGTIINKTYAEKYIRGDGGQVIMRTGAVLDISKRKKAEFLRLVGF